MDSQLEIDHRILIDNLATIQVKKLISSYEFRFKKKLQYIVSSFEANQLIEALLQLDYEIFSIGIDEEVFLKMLTNESSYLFSHRDKKIMLHISVQSLFEYYKIFIASYSFEFEDYNSLEPLLEGVILTNFKEAIQTKPMRIEWYYGGSCLQYSYFYQSLEDQFYSEAYEDRNILHNIKHFLDSKQSILILSGMPGTGKSRLVRQIMRMMNHTSDEVKGVYTTDKETLEQEKFYIEFLSGSADILILEDLDGLLLKRSEGNHIMSKLLNVSEGVLSISNNKKIVITTNIIKMKDIDPALLRIGRCFGVWKFKKLSIPRGNDLLRVLGVEPALTEEKTVADIFAMANGFAQQKQIKNVIGY